MQKNALTITLTTLVLGIFGAFLRWLQTQNIFEEETGLATPGAPISIIYVIYSVLALAVIAVIVLGWLRHYAAPKEPEQALRCATPVPQILTCVFAAIFVCCALAMLFSVTDARFPILQRLFGAFGIFGGLCLPFLLPKRSGSLNSMSGTATVIATFFFCYWLIFAYKLHAEDPVVWVYGPEMLALVATTVGVYEIAVYFHDRAKPALTIFVLQAAAFLDISAVFDSRALPLTVMIAVCALLMLLLTYLLIANLKEHTD